MLLLQFDHIYLEHGTSDIRRIVDRVDDVINRFIQEIDDSNGDEVELKIESNTGCDTVSGNSKVGNSDCE